MEELYAIDYVTMPSSELLKHPGFSLIALDAVIKIMQMPTTKIESLVERGVI